MKSVVITFCKPDGSVRLDGGMFVNPYRHSTHQFSETRNLSNPLFN